MFLVNWKFIMEMLRRSPLLISIYIIFIYTVYIDIYLFHSGEKNIKFDIFLYKSILWAPVAVRCQDIICWSIKAIIVALHIA